LEPRTGSDARVHISIISAHHYRPTYPNGDTPGLQVCGCRCVRGGWGVAKLGGCWLGDFSHRDVVVIMEWKRAWAKGSGITECLRSGWVSYCMERRTCWIAVTHRSHSMAPAQLSSPGSRRPARTLIAHCLCGGKGRLERKTVRSDWPGILVVPLVMYTLIRGSPGTV